MSIQRGDTIRANGNSYTVVAVGSTQENLVYLHLASTDRFVTQKNGRRPVQECGWYDAKTETLTGT